LGVGETLRPDQPLLSEIIRLSKVNVLRSETPTLSEEASHKYVPVIRSAFWQRS
jgi:hypothetical protein